MTLLADRLKQAGVSTADARLASLAFEVLNQTDGDVPRACDALWKRLQAESWVARELWLLPLLQVCMRDMRGPGATQAEAPKTIPRPHQAEPIARPAQPRKPISPQVKARVDELIKKGAELVKFGRLTSDGRDWARVCVHELDGMDRDGSLARAVKSKLGVLTSNSQRTLPIGELMTSKLFNEACAEARA